MDCRILVEADFVVQGKPFSSHHVVSPHTAELQKPVDVALYFDALTNEFLVRADDGEIDISRALP